MNNILRSFAPQFAKTALNKLRQKKQLKEWKMNGCPAPPPHLVKQLVISEYFEKYKYHILVETGTYLGQMVEAQKARFKKVYSIELSTELYNTAVERFKNDKNVTIIHGDSGQVLPSLLLKINDPAIFWLDGHYSAGVTAKGNKECPILEELEAIFDSKKLNHIFLIDDARCFTGTNSYPTIEQLTEYIKSKNSNYKVEVKHDIIRYAI